MSRLGKRIHKEIHALHKESQGIGIKIYVPGVSSSSSGQAGAASGDSGDSGDSGGDGTPFLDLSLPWKAYLRGPEGTPYQDCVYAISIKIPADYPHRPPEIMFINQCWHPNIGVNGHVCVDILQREWSPTLSVVKILQSIQSMLDDPDPTSPLNSSAGDMYNRAKRDPSKWDEYKQKIRSSTVVNYILSHEEQQFVPSRPVLL